MTDHLKARIAYLTSPSPGVFVLNLQIGEEVGCQRVEISRGHLANILIDGTALALRENCFHRVPELQPASAHERTINRA